MILKSIIFLENKSFPNGVAKNVDIQIGQDLNNNLTRIKYPLALIDVVLLCYSMKDMA
jgi:hypothetical protein